MKNKKILAFIIVMITLPLTTYNLLVHNWSGRFTESDYRSHIDMILDLGYRIILPETFINSPEIQSEKVCILVHDVDFSLSGIPVFMKVEKEKGIRSCYFIRPDAEYFTQKIAFFQNIESQGFEIGIHYDTLSRTHDITLARILFAAQLKLMRTFFSVQSARTHGDNFDFSINNFGIYDKDLYNALGITEFDSRNDTSEISDSNMDYTEFWRIGSNVLIANFHTDWYS